MTRRLSVLLGLVLAPVAVGAQTPDGATLVQAHCTACHSLALVESQRGDEAFWRDTIRWMQRTQNLWVIPPEQETVLLGYLAQRYAEGDSGRRPNLSPRLVYADQPEAVPDATP